MKNLLLIALMLPISILAQDSYKSKSGTVFKVGDTLLFGQPLTLSSGPFLGVGTNGEYNTVFSLDGKNLTNMNFINRKALIEKIEVTDKAKLFVKSHGKKLYVLIDEAVDKNEVIISTIEIEKLEDSDKYDKLKKLKELLDIGALTQEEFNAEKKKILSE